VSARTNIFGEPLSHPQAELADCYDRLAAVLRDQADELAPYERRGAIKALAVLWHVCDGMDLDPPQVYDLGA